MGMTYMATKNTDFLMTVTINTLITNVTHVASGCVTGDMKSPVEETYSSCRVVSKSKRQVLFDS